MLTKPKLESGKNPVTSYRLVEKMGRFMKVSGRKG